MFPFGPGAICHPVSGLLCAERGGCGRSPKVSPPRGPDLKAPYVFIPRGRASLLAYMGAPPDYPASVFSAARARLPAPPNASCWPQEAPGTVVVEGVGQLPEQPGGRTSCRLAPRIRLACGPAGMRSLPLALAQGRVRKKLRQPPRGTGGCPCGGVSALDGPQYRVRDQVIWPQFLFAAARLASCAVRIRPALKVANVQRTARKQK